MRVSAPTLRFGSNPAAETSAMLGHAVDRLLSARDLTFSGGTSGLARAVERSQQLLEASRLLRRAGMDIPTLHPAAAKVGTVLEHHAETASRLASLLPSYAVRPELGDASSASTFVDTAVADARSALSVLTGEAP